MHLTSFLTFFLESFFAVLAHLLAHPIVFSLQYKENCRGYASENRYNFEFRALWWTSKSLDSENSLDALLTFSSPTVVPNAFRPQALPNE